MDKYYKILNISENATEYEIKKSYKKLAKIYHPDKLKEKNSEKFKEINEAYNFLIKNNFKYNKTNNLNDYIYKNFEKLKNGSLKNEIFKNDLFIHIKITLTEALNGVKINYKHPNGKRYLDIPKNIGNGEIIKIPNLGKIKGYEQGNLYIKIYIKNNRYIKIVNNNIYVKAKICPIDYFFNNEKEIKILKEKIYISKKDISFFKKERKKEKRKGLYFNNQKERGDMYLTISFDYFKALKKIIKGIKRKLI